MSEEVKIAVITGAFGIATAIVSAIMSVLITRKRIGDESREREADLNKLTNHMFFSKIDTLIVRVQTTFTLENKGKEAVFKDIIVNQLKIYKKTLHDLAKSIDDGEVQDSDELYRKYISSYTTILDSLNSYYISDFSYSLEEKEVLNKVMAKYKVWSKTSDSAMLDFINSTFSSKFYNDNIIKTSVILDMYLGVASDTINDAERTLSFINGDLRGLIFAGVVI